MESKQEVSNGQGIELPLIDPKTQTVADDQDKIRFLSNGKKSGPITEINKEEDEVEFTKFTKQQILLKFKEISLAGVFVTIGIVLNIILLTINIHFAGNLSDPVLLDGLGLGNTLINFTGGYLFIGLNQGAGTLMGRAFGFKSKSLLNNYFNKGLIVLGGTFILFILLAINSKSILMAVGQNENICDVTQKYVIGIIPGLLCQFLFDLYRNYLNAQQIYYPPSIMFFIALIFHIIFLNIFVPLYKFTGIIISTNLTSIATLILVQIYMYKKQIQPQYNFKNIFINFLPYLSIVIFIALPLEVDVFCFEINSLLIGYTKNISQFGAHVAISNFIGFCYSFPSGIAGSMCYLISNAFGQKLLNKSKNYAIMGTVYAVVQFIFFFTMILCFHNQICLFFTKDEGIVYYSNRLLKLYVFFQLPDFLQVTHSGVVKSLGKAKIGLYAFITAYYAIGIPLSALFGLVFNLQLIGFWIGFFIGIVTIFIFQLFIILKCDWKKQIELTSAQISKDDQLLNEETNKIPLI